VAKQLIQEATGGANFTNVESTPESVNNSRQLKQIQESVMTFNKKQNSCASIGKNMLSVCSSDAEDIDYSHNVFEIDRGMKIKNSFDEWKVKKGEPYDPSKHCETLTPYNTDLTTVAMQKPIIIEEEFKLD
jgi:hypothetical protein